MTFNWSAVGNPVHVIIGLNADTQGVIGLLFCVFVWLMVYLATRNEPTRESFHAASLVSMICAVLLRLLCTQGYCMVVLQ